jgi:S-formylglutathione hydrolase FrmB
MALIHCDFQSKTLGMSSSMKAILPERSNLELAGVSCPPDGCWPVLYLLHGLSDDHSAWTRRTSIERYASAYPLVVVMPNAHRSFYTDMAQGLKYWTFLSEELPDLVESYFHVSERREDTFAAGLSMGGYGAFKLALRMPHKFSAAASLSGALDAASFVKSPAGGTAEMTRIFGSPEKIDGSDNDLFTFVRRLATPGKVRPKLFMCCGQSDFLYTDNQTMRRALEDNDFDFHYHEGPGDHNWAYWDAEIQNVLKWLPIRV